MTKKTKLLIGVGLLGATAYLFFKNKKKGFLNFSQSDLDACMRSNPTSDPSKCCSQVGGFYINRSCLTKAQRDAMVSEETCILGGGTFDSATQTCKTSSTQDPKLQCDVSGGVWNDNTLTCDTPIVNMPPPQISPDATTGGASNGIVSTGSNILVANPNSVILVPPTSPLYQGNMSTALGFPISDGGGGGEKDEKSLFDWIPYIIAGTTLVTAYIQERQ
jgi:hypothetical protein